MGQSLDKCLPSRYHEVITSLKGSFDVKKEDRIEQYDKVFSLIDIFND